MAGIISVSKRKFEIFKDRKKCKKLGLDDQPD